MFFVKVNHSSRKAMVDFLTRHPRYWTMNSWNRRYSYAHNVKLSHLDIPKDLMETAYEFLEVDGEEEPWMSIRDEWLAWSHAHDRDYVIGMNGRSNGYMVLFQTEKKPSQYRSRCFSCGQQNYCRVVETVQAACLSSEALASMNADHRDVELNGRWIHNKCGRCGVVGRMRNYKEPPIEVNTLTTGLDQDRDFEDWDMSSLRQRVDLIQDFDRCVDSCRDIFLDCCRHYRVVEQTVLVPRTEKVVVPVEDEHGTDGQESDVGRSQPAADHGE